MPSLLHYELRDEYADPVERVSLSASQAQAYFATIFPGHHIDELLSEIESVGEDITYDGTLSFQKYNPKEFYSEKYGKPVQAVDGQMLLQDIMMDGAVLKHDKLAYRFKTILSNGSRKSHRHVELASVEAYDNQGLTITAGAGAFRYLTGERPYVQGLGVPLMNACVRMGDKLGLAEFKLDADNKLGGYVWAKAGLVPGEGAWRDLRGQLTRRLWWYAPQIPTDLLPSIRDVIKHSRHDLTRIAAMDGITVETRDDGVQPLGKALLMGTEWSATLPLDPDTPQRQRFDALQPAQPHRNR